MRVRTQLQLIGITVIFKKTLTNAYLSQFRLVQNIQTLNNKRCIQTDIDMSVNRT